MKQELIEINKGCCNGTCQPVKIVIYNNLDVLYHRGSPCKGPRDLSRGGPKRPSMTRQFTIDLNTLNKVIELVRDSDFWNLRDRYVAPITDVQITTITINYINLKKTITIKGHNQVPVGLNRLINGIEKIIDQFPGPLNLNCGAIE